MRIKYRNTEVPIHVFFLICIGILVAGYLFLLGEIKKVKEQKDSTAQEVIVYKDKTPLPTSSPREVVTTQKPFVTPKPEERITYLNLNGSFTTKSTDWTDVGSTDVLINLVDEYGANAYVDWDAAINTGSSGSKVFVRLYDVTHNIGVNGSDLETNSTTSTRVASGRLYLWRGQNTYRVQIKSLNGIDATFDGGRIKIVY